VAWALEYLHLCRKSNKQLIILKFDFEKAFDKVEHNAMLEIMQHKGFWAEIATVDVTDLFLWDFISSS